MSKSSWAATFTVIQLLFDNFEILTHDVLLLTTTKCALINTHWILKAKSLLNSLINNNLGILLPHVSTPLCQRPASVSTFLPEDGAGVGIKLLVNIEIKINFLNISCFLNQALNFNILNRQLRIFCSLLVDQTIFLKHKGSRRLDNEVGRKNDNNLGKQREIWTSLQFKRWRKTIWPCPWDSEKSNDVVT